MTSLCNSRIRVNQPNIDRLFELFQLDTERGVLIWIKKPSPLAGNVVVGSEAGCLGSANEKYLRVMFDARRYIVHRLIWAMVHGRNSDLMIDHINGNTVDNRPSNLREATHAQNKWNSVKNHNSRSPYKGVHWHVHHRKWVSSFRQSGKLHVVGYYDDIEEARMNYLREVKRVRGEFAHVG